LSIPHKYLSFEGALALTVPQNSVHAAIDRLAVGERLSMAIPFRFFKAGDNPYKVLCDET
jgi:hypothetical protein